MINSRLVGLGLGPLLFVLLMFLLPEHMPAAARMVACTSALMAAWWITEAIPIPATSMLPILMFPLVGVMNGNEVTLHYANHLVYLFLGGFLIGAAIEKSNLHHRIALLTIRLTGLSSRRVILGFMLSSAFLSMWISNTAAAMIMFTIAMAFLAQLEINAAKAGQSVPRAFGSALMLSVAYAASIGGVATLVGTPANAVLVGVYETTFGASISFVDWMVFATPLALGVLLLVWWMLVHVCFPCKGWELPIESDWLKSEIASLGPMRSAERRTLVVCLVVILAWLVRGFADWELFGRVQDSTIAIAGGLILFLVPAGHRTGALLDWEGASKIPWDVLLLFGGGFALAAGFVDSGLVSWLAEQLDFLATAPLWAVVLCLATLVIFLTELTSNTATAAMLLPVTVSIAAAMGAEPLVLMATAAIASSFAFMMPVATPPNAIVFSSRWVSIREMAATGFWLNLEGVLVISCYVLLAASLLV